VSNELPWVVESEVQTTGWTAVAGFRLADDAMQFHRAYRFVSRVRDTRLDAPTAPLDCAPDVRPHVLLDYTLPAKPPHDPDRGCAGCEHAQARPGSIVFGNQLWCMAQAPMLSLGSVTPPAVAPSFCPLRKAATDAVFDRVDKAQVAADDERKVRNAAAKSLDADAVRAIVREEYRENLDGAIRQGIRAFASEIDAAIRKAQDAGPADPTLVRELRNVMRKRL